MNARLPTSVALVALTVLAYGCPDTAGSSVTQAQPESEPKGTGDEAKVAVEPSDQAGAADPSPKRANTAQPDRAAPPERPWARNTGPVNPSALKPSGPLKVTTDGAVLDNLDISGMVKIDADDVTMRNFRIKSSAPYGIRIADGHTGIVLEDGEISGMDSAGILGVGYTARRLHIHDSGGDGIKAQGTGGPTLVESCFIEKLGKNEGSHADGNQTRGGSNITFRYNNIYMPSPGTPKYPGPPYKSNATFLLQLEISNFVIEHNWLTGGNYTIHGGKGVSVRRNIFGRDNGGLTAGKEGRRIRRGDFDEWSGNVWEDSGDPI